MCVSYRATLRLMDDISQLHKVPINGSVMEPSSSSGRDNVDKQRYVRDLRSDHQGEMLHMFSVIVGQSSTPAPELPFMGQLSQLAGTPISTFCPAI